MEVHNAAEMRDGSTAVAPPADEQAVAEAVGGRAGGGVDGGPR
jgi:hypothetical protein